MQKKDEEKKPAKKILFTTDGTKVALNGYCMYFLRTSTKRNLGEETFQVDNNSNNNKSSKRFIPQREIMAGLVNATVNENLLWTIERTVSNVFIPLLNTNCMGDKGSNQLLIKVTKNCAF